MRHPRGDDLLPLAGLLDALRGLGGLVEKSPAVFYRRSKAFLHFHVDGGDLYADVRLGGGDFDRMRVTSKDEQRALLGAVRRVLAQPS